MFGSAQGCLAELVVAKYQTQIEFAARSVTFLFGLQASSFKFGTAAWVSCGDWVPFRRLLPPRNNLLG